MKVLNSTKTKDEEHQRLRNEIEVVATLNGVLPPIDYELPATGQAWLAMAIATLLSRAVGSTLEQRRRVRADRADPRKTC